MLRNALLECRSIHRTFGIWLFLVLILLGLAAWIQEPAVLRRSGVQLFWGAVDSGLVLALAVVPLAWVLARRPPYQQWLLARARGAWDLVLPPFLGMTIYGACLSGIASGLFFTLDRISAVPAPLRDVGSLALSAWCFLLPLAAIAPGLASRSWGHATRVLVYLFFAGGTLLLTAPTSLAAGAELGAELGGRGFALVPTVLASAAGILLSLHLVLRSTSN